MKSALIDGIDRASVPVLFFRSIQGSITNIINFTNNKYLPMTIIAIFNNLAPLIAVVLAYYILKEKIATWTVVMIGFTLIGVLEVVFTGDTAED
jgi:drug/metabolite transporter (DMT)-like permease